MKEFLLTFIFLVTATRITRIHADDTINFYSERSPCKGVPNGKFVQDPSSCQGWLQCFNGEGKLGRCRDGYLFDRKSGSCNYKDKVECKTRNPCNSKPDGTFVYNPASCSSYYLCINEKPIPGVCPNQLHFNPKIQQCVEPNKYPCDSTNGPNLGDIACQGLPDYEFVENEENCGEYFVCVNEHGRPGKCPIKYLYNPIKGICDFEENIDCPEPTTKPPPEKNQCDGIPDGKFIKDSSSCAAYIQCINGKPNKGRCDKGFWFNPKNGMCDYPENVECTPNLCEGIEHGKFIADPDYCGRFIQCVNGTAKQGQCEKGYLFNPLNGMCDYEENVDCNDNPNTTTTTTTEEPPISTTSEEPSTVESTTESSTESSTEFPIEPPTPPRRLFKPPTPPKSKLRKFSNFLDDPYYDYFE